MPFISHLIPKRWRPRWRVLLTEIGGHATGDQALCSVVVRRLLRAGCDVTLLQRNDMVPTLQRAGLRADPTVARRWRAVNIPLSPERFMMCGSAAAIIHAFQQDHPDLYERTTACLAHADVVMTIPGCRMMDGYAVPRNLAVSFLAMQRGIPVINLHQSIGPLGSESWRGLVSEWLRGSALSLIRDEKSMAFVRSLGVPEGRHYETRDLLFSEESPAVTAPVFDLGINLRFGAGGHSSLDTVSLLLERVRKERATARMIMYSTTDPMPEEMVQKARAQVDHVEPLVLDPDTSWDRIGRCAINITDSFHGMVFAMMARRLVMTLRPDHQAWKMEGTTAPGANAVTPIASLQQEADVVRVLEGLRRMEERADEQRHHNETIVQHGRAMAEAGWQRVLETLREA